jgi:hypothetical protein
MTAPNRRSVTAGDVIHRVALHAFDLGFGSPSAGKEHWLGTSRWPWLERGKFVRFCDRNMQARTAFTGLFEIAT